MHVYPDEKKKKKEREREKVQWKKTRSIVNFNEIQVQKGFEGRGGKTKFHLLLRKLEEQSMAINPIQ